MKIINRLEETETLMWLVKILVMVSLVLLISNLAFVAAFFSILPLKEIKPYLLQVFPKSEQVISVESIEKTSNGMSLLMEQLARQYVELRETIDLQTENFRWERMKYFESEEVSLSFHDLMKKENKDSPLLKFGERKIKRRVYILSSNSLGPTAPNIWQVEWLLVDFDTKRQKEINRKTLISTITAEAREQQVQEEFKLINPIGFTVINYGTSIRNKEDLYEKE